MTDLAAFCARFGIDPAAARAALDGHATRDDAPWYVQAVLGLGAWVTAIAGLAFVWAVMDFVLGIDEPDLVIAALGAALFAASLWLLHLRPDGAFVAHMAAAFATAGTILAAAGIGVPQESLWAAALATLPFAAAALWQQRSQLLQFLVISVALIAWMIAAWDEWQRDIVDLAVIAVPVGALMLLHPPRRDMRAASIALLIVPELVTIAVLNFEPGRGLWLMWLPKIVFLVVFGLLFALNWRRFDPGRDRLLALAGGILAVAAALVLPSGSAVALVILLLAYTLGSRTLAAIGALAEVYFIWDFYTDLQSTLLTKSCILMGVGLALLLCYGLLATIRRRSAA